MQALNISVKRRVVLAVFALISVFGGTISFAAQSVAPAIKAVDLNALKGDRMQLRLTMTAPVAEPKAFMIESPAKIVLDFPGVKSLLKNKDASPNFNKGVVRDAKIVEGDNRTRVVVGLNANAAYEVAKSGNYIFLTISNEAIQKSPTTTSWTPEKLEKSAKYSVKDIDFRRGKHDEGRLVIHLSDPKMPIDLKEEGNRIILKMTQTQLPEHLQRKLDVTDFGTPIRTVNAIKTGGDVEITLELDGLNDSMAYQADNQFTVEVRKLSKKEKEKLEEENFEYTGERLSLNFQDIEVRAVLQLIADFTSLNIVTSDTVQGNVTLRLRNVPWDQALAIILKTKGLGKRQIGNVLMIGPSEELAAREKLELQAQQQVQELAPLRSEYIQINYAKASDISALLKDETNTLLSARGSASVDERTNTLLVQDTSVKMDQIRALVHRLDVPIKQVLIESRVVFANDDFEDALGVRFGGALKFRPGNEPVLGLTGSGASASALATTPPHSPSTVPYLNRLGVNLPAVVGAAAGQSAQLGLSIARLPGGTILDLELQALEAEGLGKIIASPRLVTSNQQQAYIEAGEEIPYQESTSSGAASIAFKKAVLRLEVTPQITPDDHVFLDLTVNQDTRGQVVVAGGVPAIDTREIHTKVLVANGDTVVLGGIYQQTKAKTITRVPFLGRLPMVGWLFKSEGNIDNRNELMIFVTPKIIQEGVA